ncbi:hypothetical protein C7S10_21560 [Nocardioides currus]|uniref:ABC3 transporter permease C-terminal domain-containing protein n=1 Tax=Nocardioides currus TaxID=2133958 RepID=A0A2R7YRM0_9ACTN|nr:hypothetical protein C7S10_21560 [Nocardioides currus]
MGGRWRADWPLLLLTGLVVALTVGLAAAVDPVTERAADRAIAAAVHDAGASGAVVATLPAWYDDPRGKTRDPSTAVQVRQDADYARQALPAGLDAVLRPGVAWVTTPTLQVRQVGPTKLLQLAFVDTAGEAPAVTYDEGGPPRAVPRRALGLVEVALSQTVADALELEAGDRRTVQDEQGRSAKLRVSGVFTPGDPDAEAWDVSARLLHPVQGTADGLPYTSAAALVSAGSLADLRLVLPADDLTRRVSFRPDPSRVRWLAARSLEREIVSLQASASLSRGDVAWDSLLGSTLERARADIASARGRADVLLIGLLAATLLVLVLAAQLLVLRRRDPLTMARQRGASLASIGLELLVEGLTVAVLGAVVGLGAVVLVTGSAGWAWAVPVAVVAALASPVLGASWADVWAGARRVPANRSARRTATRTRLLRRLAVETAVLLVAALSFSALLQRGVAGDGAAGGDVTAASAPTWWAVAGALVLLRVLPVPVRWALRATRRSPGGVGFFVAARIGEAGARALPVLVVVVAVAGITLGASLAESDRAGQTSAALSSVGGDARIDADPQADLAQLAEDAEDEPGVDAAAAARVEDGARLSSGGASQAVRLVVVDAGDYAALLAASNLADAPQLGRLDAADGDEVPALLVGGDSVLRDTASLRWEDTSVPIDVVGTAPDVDASAAPVLVVDTDSFAAAGAVALPDTLWVVGTGTDAALDRIASRVDGVDSVVRLSDELEARRTAPLPSALIDLAVASSVLLLVLGILGLLLSAAAQAPERARSLGRLRALGLPQGEVRRVLVGELAVPVAVAALAGWLLGVACSYAMLGSLTAGSPTDVEVSWWTIGVVPILVVAAVAVAVLEWRRIRRRPLSQLLRT